MTIIEYICGLFPSRDYSFPEGDFNISSANKKYTIQSMLVVRLDKRLFGITEELKRFYSLLINKSKKFISRLEYHDDLGILISERFFRKNLDEYCKEKEDLRVIILRLCEECYSINIRVMHEFNNKEMAVLDYINKIRDTEGDERIKKIFFQVVRRFHEIVMISRAPYAALIEVNFLYLNGVYGYFCDDKNMILTKVKMHKFDYWEPKITGLNSFVKKHLNKNAGVPLSQLLVAKAKIYYRLNNYSMSIIHIVIALDIIVSSYLNNVLKGHGVNSDAVEDFHNKFGLSVRVKALLKLVLPRKQHHLLKNAGIAISHRNKIIHEGKSDEALENSNIEKIINDCAELINVLNKMGKNL